MVGEDASRFGLDAAVGLTTGAVALVRVTVLATWAASRRLGSVRITGVD